MSSIRVRIEKSLETFAHFIYRHRYKTLFVMVVLVAVLASQLPRIETDTSTEGFLRENDPTRLTYEKFRRQFGRDELIFIAIEPQEVFSQDFLKRLKAFHEDLENEVPYLDEITSLVNARNTRGEQDRLIVEDLLYDWPEDATALEDLKKRVLSNPLYLNRLISEDGRLTTVVIKTNSYSTISSEEEALEGFDETAGEGVGAAAVSKQLYGKEGIPVKEPPVLTGEENSAVVKAVRELVARYRAADFKLYLAGSPVVMEDHRWSMKRDMAIFVLLALLTICVFLFIMFRRLTGLLLPLLIVALTVLSTFGLMALLRIPIKIPSTMLPSFLLVVGVADSVHILAIFYQKLAISGDREEAICHALGHSGLAVVVTSLTTAIGLASFLTAELAPIADLGIAGPLGVLIALVYTLVLLPALLAIIPVRVKETGRSNSETSFVSRLLRGAADFSTAYPKSIVLISLFLMLVSLAGVPRITFSHSVLAWLPYDFPVRGATDKIDKELKGTVVLEVVVDTGKENGLYDISTLNALDSLGSEIEKIDQGELFVGITSSVTDILKEIYRALNENRPEFYRIPQDPKLIPQAFLLFENSGSDDLEDVVDSQFSQARFTIKVPYLDAFKYLSFLSDIENRFLKAFDGKARITVTGMMALQTRTLYAAIYSMVKSYITVGVVISLTMVLFIGSLRMGLLSMIPNLLPIFMTLGFIGWFGIRFDMFTMLIGSISVGIVVDDTIHFMHNFRRYFLESKDVRHSVRRTLNTTGWAMLVTSIVLSLGFFIYIFSALDNLVSFGLLTGVTIIMALLADFLVAPALMALAYQQKKKHKEV